MSENLRGAMAEKRNFQITVAAVEIALRTSVSLKISAAQIIRKHSTLKSMSDCENFLLAVIFTGDTDLRQERTIIFWEIEPSYLYWLEGIFQFFVAIPGPYNFPGKLSKIIHTSDFVAHMNFRGTWYWYVNFPSLFGNECLYIQSA